MIIRDYGVRPELNDDYFDMVTRITKKEVLDLTPERLAELDRPYLRKDYSELQNFHPINYDVPYLTPMDQSLRVENPPVKPVAKARGHVDAKMIINEVKQDHPTIQAFSGTLGYLYMAGFDAEGQPWDQQKIKWRFLIRGRGKIKFVRGKWTYYSGEDAINRVYTDNIEGTTPDGLSSRVSVRIVL